MASAGPSLSLVIPADYPAPLGPRLYKEPSAKSNKFIIHNALSHCCLAGKVNEPQKNRILEVCTQGWGPAGGMGALLYWLIVPCPPGN